MASRWNPWRRMPRTAADSDPDGGCGSVAFMEPGNSRNTRPTLSTVLGRLRAREAELRARGVSDLWVFGSVARGDAKWGSDVDLACEFDAPEKVSLFDIIHLKDTIEDALEASVDIGERSAMRSQVARSAERDMVRIF